MPALSEHNARPRYAMYSSEEWEKHRTLITRLYNEKHLSAEVVCKMLADINFFVSPRMLKARITPWGLDKKVKRRDMCTAAYMAASRAPDIPVEDIEFRIRHRIVTWKEVVAYFRRKKILDPIEWIRNRPADSYEFSSDVKLLAPETSADAGEEEIARTDFNDGGVGGASDHDPLQDVGSMDLALDSTSWNFYQMIEELSCNDSMFSSITSPWQRPSTPAPSLRADEISSLMRDYCDGYINSTRSLKHIEPPVHHKTIHGMFGGRIQDGISLLLRDQQEDGFASINSALDLLFDLLNNHHPMAFAQIITVICELIARKNMLSLVQQIVIHLKDMSIDTRCAVPPISAIMNTLLHAEDDVTYLLLVAMRVAVDNFKSVTGMSQWKLLYLEERLCDCLFHVGDENERIARRSRLFEAQQEHYGPIARNVLWTLSNVAHDKLVCGRFDEAKSAFRVVLDRSDSHEGFDRAKSRFAALEGLAEVAMARVEDNAVVEVSEEDQLLSFNLSRKWFCEACDLLQEADDLASTYFGRTNRRAMRVRVKLAEIKARYPEFEV